MTTITYSHTYPFRQGAGIWRNYRFPIITVRLSYQGIETRVQALIDTGALYSAFDSKIANILEIDINRLQRHNAVGFTGSWVSYPFHPELQVKFEPLPTPVLCPAFFVDGLQKNSGFNLLGRRGVFEHLLLSFDESAGNVYMATKS